MPRIGFIFLLIVMPVFVARSYAQVDQPTSKDLFEEERKGVQEQREAATKQILKRDAPATQDFDFEAPTVEYDKETNVITGSGGVLISGRGMQIQADNGKSDLDTNDAELKGDVLITTDTHTISADAAQMNLDSEVGSFDEAEMILEEGGFKIFSNKLEKASETQYNLFDAWLTTCHCPDGYTPWRIECSEANITQEGYAHTYGTKLNMFGLPSFYTPYLGFPVKSERQSGLLVPTFGYGSEDGVQLKLPVFLVLDEQTDVTLSPFIETKTRYGTGVDFRRAFSTQHDIDTHMVFSDESERDGDLRGTKVNDLFDRNKVPPFDEERFGGALRYKWSSEQDVAVPTSIISDVHYVSDDLFLREMEDDRIGERQARYTLSNAVIRSALGDFVTAELSGEYVQPFDRDDDLQIQRLPEFRVSGSRSFRPFGYNPYGLKVVPGAQAVVTDFARDQGYDGLRFDMLPNVTVPFHYKNFLASALRLGVRQTNYQLSDNTDPESGEELEEDTSRTLFNMDFGTSTAIERAFDIEQGNWFQSLTSLGVRNQAHRLERIKHVVEPYVKYTFIPATYQGDLPLFDEVDSIRQRSLITYGFRTSLLGRFAPRQVSGETIESLAPRIDDLPSFPLDQALTDFSAIDNINPWGTSLGPNKGEIREIVTLGMRQNFDYTEEQKDLDPGRESVSDLGTDLTLVPTQNFALRFDSNLDVTEQDFSSWAVGTHFRDDRGDVIRARYSYQDQQISQLEGNIELVLLERLRAGYYTRFDDQESEFVENRFLFRFSSACKCWHFDVGMADRINPDKQFLIMSFTFGGLGDIGQRMRYGEGDSAT